MKLKNLIPSKLNERRTRLTEAKQMFVTTYRVMGNDYKFYTSIKDKPSIQAMLDQAIQGGYRIIGRIAEPMKADAYGQSMPSGAADQFEHVNEVDYSTMRLKSNIDQKWDSTDTMMDDLRQYIGSAVAAGGPELGMDIADALKIMTNFANGEVKTAQR